MKAPSLGRFIPSNLAKLLAKGFYLFALGYQVFSLVIYAFVPQLESFAFPMLGGFRMSPPFGDLRWVTATSECGINLEDLAEGRLWGCDPYERGGGEMGYPPLSVEIARFLHVQGSHTGILGLTMGLATIGILLALLHRLQRPGWSRDVYGGLVLISFPLQLGLERSNIDLVIFLLLTSLSAFIACCRWWGVPLAGFVAWMAVGIKLYPIAGITTWLGLVKIRRERFDAVRVATLFGAALGLSTALPWFLNHGGAAADPGADRFSHAFLVTVPWLWSRIPQLGKDVQSVAQPMVGLAIVGMVVYWCAKVDLSGKWERLLSQRTDGYTGSFFRIMPALLGCVWLGCFFLSSSYDYRLILAVPAFICLLALLSDLQEDIDPWANLLLSLVAISGFISFTLPLFFFRLAELGFEHPHPLGVRFAVLLQLSDLFLMPVLAGSMIGLLMPGREESSVLSIRETELHKTTNVGS